MFVFAKSGNRTKLPSSKRLESFIGPQGPLGIQAPPFLLFHMNSLLWALLFAFTQNSQALPPLWLLEMLFLPLGPSLYVLLLLLPHCA